jgi:hypothetical protein
MKGGEFVDGAKTGTDRSVHAARNTGVLARGIVAPWDRVVSPGFREFLRRRGSR